MSVILGDPDTFVQWMKTDEPGENPKWESQCGVIEQIGFGDNTLFQGFVGGQRTPLKPKSVLSVVKKEVEAGYQRFAELKWSYENELWPN